MRQTSAATQIAQRYAHVRECLNERARRLFVARAAVAQWYGGISLVSRATCKTIRPDVPLWRGADQET